MQPHGAAEIHGAEGAMTEPAAALTAVPLLTGAVVVLEPLREEHWEELLPVALDEELWRWTLTQVRTAADLREYIGSAVALARAGDAVPFLVRHRASGRAAGSTRFANIDRQHARLEIGWSWIGREWQRTAVNTETKYLLLRYAFEEAGMRRVEFKTDALNARSRAALARIGAVEEGTLRSHMITATGRSRDSVYFSILATEWPAVKQRLQEKLAQHAGERA